MVPALCTLLINNGCLMNAFESYFPSKWHSIIDSIIDPSDKSMGRYNLTHSVLPHRAIFNSPSTDSIYWDHEYQVWMCCSFWGPLWFDLTNTQAMDFDSYYMLSRDRPNEEWHRWTDISEVLLILLNEDSIYNIVTSLITFKIIDWYAMRLWPFRGMHSYWIWVAEQVGSCNIHTIRHAWQAEFFSPGIWMIDVAKSALPDTRWTFHGAEVFWTWFSYLPTSNKHPSFRCRGAGMFHFISSNSEWCTRRFQMPNGCLPCVSRTASSNMGVQYSSWL